MYEGLMQRPGAQQRQAVEPVEELGFSALQPLAVAEQISRGESIAEQKGLSCRVRRSNTQDEGFFGLRGRVGEEYF